MPVKASTAEEWVKGQPAGHFQLLYSPDKQFVTTIICNLCTKHKDTLKLYRNFSDSFVVGISGPGLKKDQVHKHITKSEQHRRALERESSFQPKLTPLEIYTKTPIGWYFDCYFYYKI